VKIYSSHVFCDNSPYSVVLWLIFILLDMIFKFFIHLLITQRHLTNYFSALIISCMLFYLPPHHFDMFVLLMMSHFKFMSVSLVMMMISYCLRSEIHQKKWKNMKKGLSYLFLCIQKKKSFLSSSFILYFLWGLVTQKRLFRIFVKHNITISMGCWMFGIDLVLLINHMIVEMTFYIFLSFKFQWPSLYNSSTKM
jgi:hypothetical protein